MDLSDLVHAILGFDALSARQWLADAQRAGFVWAETPVPVGLDATELATAAGVAELLAGRAGQKPPGWAASVPPAPERLFLSVPRRACRACGLSASRKAPSR